MIDPGSISVLSDVIRGESCSFLMYLGDSLPWPAVDGRKVQEKLGPLIDAERRSIAAVGNLLSRHHVPPPSSGFYPSRFTTSNFVSLQYLLKPLRDEARISIAVLERQVKSVDDARARDALQHLLDTKRRNLQELERMPSSPLPAAAAAQ